MRYGIREICDVVLKRKTPGWFGNLYLPKGAPVLYFDTLKTSSLEGASSTVYAQGGRGNPRLIAWDGDRTLTFTMEDALISPESFSILSGAGFMSAEKDNDKLDAVYVHCAEQLEIRRGDGDQLYIQFTNTPAGGYANAEDASEKEIAAEMYMMVMTEDGIIDTSLPPIKIAPDAILAVANNEQKRMDNFKAAYEAGLQAYNEELAALNDAEAVEHEVSEACFREGRVLYIDYYAKAERSVKQIDIEANKFGGSYYLEASTLFRSEQNGEDYAAEFIIPNCKVQSNFTFTMAPTGDPSTFTFTMDAFPDYTKFDKTKKVLAALQIVEDPNALKA